MSAVEPVHAPEHPRIPPWLRPVARGGGEVQFGVSPGGPIVAGVSEPEAGVLALLDGSVSLPASYQLAGRAGIPAGRWRALVELVDQLGVLERPSRPRHPGRVVLDGRGHWVDEVAVLLRRGGLDIVVHPEAELEPTAPDSEAPALVVLVEPAALDPRRGDPWQRRGVSHLPVTVAGSNATVGPLVRPGGPGPCLWCLDLHRTDHDGSWPTVMARLFSDAGAIVRAAVAPTVGDAVLGQLVSACIGLIAHGHLEGRPSPPGVSVDVAVPWPRVDHRRWSVHPHCSRHPVARVA